MKINYPLVIDGGLSNQLEEQGWNLDHKLWSANLLIEHPEAITQAHLAYLEAGAQCISTSSYQATIPGIMSMGFDRTSAEDLILRTVSLAEEAGAKFMTLHPESSGPLIAASIGPYGAFLADGSEYRGDYGVSDRELRDFHLRRIELLDASNADILACETIPSFQEAKVLSELLMDTKKRSWISFSCKDEEHLNDGTSIRECAMFFARHPNVFAIGVNCTAPRYISGLIREIKNHSGEKKVVVYPNSGEVYDAENKTWSGITDPSSCERMAKEWLDQGADIIGGCCRMGPEHIKALSLACV